LPGHRQQAAAVGGAGELPVLAFEVFEQFKVILGPLLVLCPLASERQGRETGSCQGAGNGPRRIP